MNFDYAVLDCLQSFLRWKTNYELTDLTPDFGWPVESRAFARCLRGYTWASTVEPKSQRVFGICPLPGRPRARLSLIEASLFAPRASRLRLEHPCVNRLEYYLVVEWTPRSAEVELVMRSATSHWYSLDKHIIRAPNSSKAVAPAMAHGSLPCMAPLVPAT